jgi:Domain of unknown function (DUF4411)
VAADVYIIDANVMIEAASVYYAFDRVPRFWEWLTEQCTSGKVRSVSLVKDEVTSPAELVAWLKEREAEGLLLDSSDPAIQTEFRRMATWVISQGFGPEHVAKFLDGADLWIIAAASVHGATVVTQEKSVGSGSKKIKIPDVCSAFRVTCANTFTLMDELDARL